MHGSELKEGPHVFQVFTIQKNKEDWENPNH